MLAFQVMFRFVILKIYDMKFYEIPQWLEKINRDKFFHTGNSICIFAR